MTLFLLVLLFLAGVALLWAGAELLVRGAAAMGRALGLSTLVVGLTIVSLATSMPEFSVSLVAALRGSPGLALGNVVGSNIANIGLVLGSCALVAVVVPGRSLVRRDVPLMIGVSLLFVALAYAGGEVRRVDGVVLLGALLAILVKTVVAARREGASLEEGIRYLPLPRAIVYLGVGLVGMLLGAELITRSGVAIAEILGVPDVIIGLTMVAVGTSLPEFAASVVSMARGHHGIAVGNVIGSNVFNLTFVIGGVALVHPIPVPPTMFSGELPVMIAFSVAAFLFMAVGGGIGRWRGLGFLAAYLAFIVWLTLR